MKSPGPDFPMPPYYLSRAARKLPIGNSQSQRLSNTNRFFTRRSSASRCGPSICRSAWGTGSPNSSTGPASSLPVARRISRKPPCSRTSSPMSSAACSATPARPPRRTPSPFPANGTSRWTARSPMPCGAASRRRSQRGRLKVFLGYAAGVGKSFQMLDEGRRRRERGEDVVACALQLEYPPDIQSILQRLETIPTLRMGDREAIDVPSVIRRHPQVALVDGLAHENPPTSPNAYRWQEVEQLLDARISVIATVNLEYLDKHQVEV